jgi:hypothetical protein
MAKSGKRKPAKLKMEKPQKLRVMIERKKNFADEWEESLVTEAWVLECERNEASKLRGMYGDYAIGKEGTEE